MTTARDIITMALREVGVAATGQTPLSEDINNGYTYLRMMMAVWQKKRFLVPGLTQVFNVGTTNEVELVGPGDYYDFPVRPNKISSAYFIQLNTGQPPVSYPLRPIFAYEDWANLVALKTLNSFPLAFFYEGSQSGKLRVWPIPGPTYEIHLVINAHLDFPDPTALLNSTFDLPEEYEEAIHYNLLVRLFGMYPDVDGPSKLQMNMAKSSLAALRQINGSQIPILTMPPALRGPTGFNLYNPDYS